MLKAIGAAVIVYLLADAGLNYILEPLGLGYMHAFLAMFCGMLAGGYLANRNFIWIALALNLFSSTLTYLLIANMREQSPIDLLLEQHPMISIGSFAGAALGAWLGGEIRQRKSAS
jgi:hypothetical protein